MKKKILALAFSIVMLAIAAVGGTLAYFTDTDAQVNVFTYGNVKIDQFEDFNTDTINIIPSVFVPAPGYDPSAGYGTIINTVEKEIYIENVGIEEAYVRVHIAVPKLAGFIMNNSTDPVVTAAAKKINDANRDVLNLSRDEHTVTNQAGNADENLWNWGTKADSVYNTVDDRNTYDVEILGIPYKVYVVTYEGILNEGDITINAINGVYMHSEVTNEMIQYLDQTFADAQGAIWARVYVVAEAAQADGFNIEVDASGITSEIPNAEKDGTAAFKALNTAFGDPADTDPAKQHKLTADAFLAASEGDTQREMTAVGEQP